MQQINLYTQAFRPDRSPLRLLHMLWSGLALMVLLLIFSLVYRVQLERDIQQLAQTDERIIKLRNDLAVFTVADGAISAVSWDKKIAQAQEQLKVRARIKELIQQQDFGNAEGFSSQLTALAQNSTEDISLSSFYLLDGGAYVELEGVAHRAGAVPQYLQRLHSEKAFARTSFGVMRLTQDEKNNAQHYFRISKAADNNK